MASGYLLIFVSVKSTCLRTYSSRERWRMKASRQSLCFVRSFFRSFVARRHRRRHHHHSSLPSRTTYPRVILDELELFRQLFRVLTPDVEEPRLRRAHELDEDGPSLGGALGHGRSLAVFLAFASDDRLLVKLCPPRHSAPEDPATTRRVLNGAWCMEQKDRIPGEIRESAEIHINYRSVVRTLPFFVSRALTCSR